MHKISENLFFKHFCYLFFPCRTLRGLKYKNMARNYRKSGIINQPANYLTAGSRNLLYTMLAVQEFCFAQLKNTLLTF